MKPYLFENIHCPYCNQKFDYQPDNYAIVCVNCSQEIPLDDGVPVFTSHPEGMIPSEKLVRGPDVGTPWRKANWKYLEDQVSSLDQDALILDVGAGRGDFSLAFTHHKYIALDIFPYPEIDIVCDLTQINPFDMESIDVIVLMNVLEHVYETDELISTLVKMLKSNGILIIAIPFLVKLHQEPIDYVRYTHYALTRLANNYGLDVVSLQGYYDPIFFLEEGIGNIRNAILPSLNRTKRYLAKVITGGIQLSTSLLQKIIGEGNSLSPSKVRSKAPTGYQAVFRKAVK